MFSLIALVVAVFATSTTASPVSSSKLFARNTDIAPTVEVCTGNVGTGCVNIPVVSDTCVNFTGGLTFLNGEVSSVVVPGGFVCTFIGRFGCDSVKGGAVALTGGSWSMFSVPGTNGNTNFNDLASSFTCSPL